MNDAPVTRAAMLIIGNEILSGRTRDANLAYAAEFLNARGVVMSEARVVRDEAAVIIEALNELRRRYDYVLTSGGLGPTHDDMTSEAIAQAFGVPCEHSDDAAAVMAAYYGGREHLTEARLRMARLPRGALPIENPVTGAPGFQILNVFAFAGVPKIQQAMLQGVAHRFEGGEPLTTHTLRADTGESAVAELMRAVQADYPDVSVGSYPTVRPDGRPLVRIVCRGTDVLRLHDCLERLRADLKTANVPAVLELPPAAEVTDADDHDIAGDDCVI